MIDFPHRQAIDTMRFFCRRVKVIAGIIPSSLDLVLKVQNPDFVNLFRTIRIYNANFKILSKMIVNIP